MSWNYSIKYPETQAEEATASIEEQAAFECHCQWSLNTYRQTANNGCQIREENTLSTGCREVSTGCCGVSTSARAKKYSYKTWNKNKR